MRLSNHECYRTGDINFFAACMAVGIPPLWEPGEVFASDDSRDYHSFRLSTISECGLHRTVEMDRAWNYPKQFAEEHPGHPFALLMDFIRSARGSKTKTEWMEKAADFLLISRDAMRRAMRDVKELEALQGESPLAYIVCFIHARFDALTMIKKVTPKEVMNERDGPGIVMFSGNLPKRMKEFFMRKL